MKTYETSKEIGEVLAIHLSENDSLTLNTDAVNGVNAVVAETPDNIPTEEYQTVTTICKEVDRDTHLEIYAQLTDMGEMSVDYEVYALRVYEDGTDVDLGLVRKMVVSYT